MQRMLLCDFWARFLMEARDRTVNVKFEFNLSSLENIEKTQPYIIDAILTGSFLVVVLVVVD